MTGLRRALFVPATWTAAATLRGVAVRAVAVVVPRTLST
jgi:hypothetical protein